MRKLLLASSALVGAAMLAAPVPAFAGDLTVKLSGYDNVIAGFFQESQHTDPVTTFVNTRNNVGIENLFDLTVNVTGKGSNNLDYGALISLWNGPDYTNAWAPNPKGNAAHTSDAYVWMSNNWGKLMLGDEHGASDLFVYAPTVGTNQIDGNYSDFVDLNKLWRAQPTFIDNTDDSTRITYYTPVVSGFQAGISYTPNLFNEGAGIQTVTANAVGASPFSTGYDNQVEGALAWSGSYDKVNLKASALVTSAQGNKDVLAGAIKDEYVSMGIGGQANFSGFTVGASYTDPGSYGEIKGQDKNQFMWTVGGKYEWDKAAVAVNFEDGAGYNVNWGVNGLPAGLKTGENVIDTDYVRSFDAIGLGATYTWFPGLVSGIDVVFFDQYGAASGGDDQGEVVMLSQRVNF